MCRFNNLEARLSEALEINRLCRIREARMRGTLRLDTMRSRVDN